MEFLNYRYQRATETFLQFKEALVELIKSIHQVSSIFMFMYLIFFVKFMLVTYSIEKFCE